mmetsp:Transcript_6715/g.13439  ORF Transcript_6715/g.13439 Transcript_6715/m.13439 type:complete len:98 (+) Transcript_6715:415-708(+)
MTLNELTLTYICCAQPAAPLSWASCFALLYMSVNLLATATFYIVILMPCSFSYKLRLKKDSIRLLNVVVINGIFMQGAAAELFGGSKLGKFSWRLRG